MTNDEILIPVPGRLHSVAKEGHLGGADEIYDDYFQLDLETINKKDYQFLLDISDTIDLYKSELKENIQEENERAIEAESNLQKLIYSIVADKAELNISANPNVFFVNTPKDISLTATSNIGAETISILKGNNLLGMTENLISLSVVDELVSSLTAQTISYTARFNLYGNIKEKRANISIVYPIYYGSGLTQDEVFKVKSDTPRTSMNNVTYNIKIENSPKYIWFFVPSNMANIKAKMNGFDFPLILLSNITNGNILYKVFRTEFTLLIDNYPIIITTV